MMDLKHYRQDELRKLVGKAVSFNVRWNDLNYAGVISRISAHTIWVGAACYHHDDLSNLLEISHV